MAMLRPLMKELPAPAFCTCPVIVPPASGSTARFVLAAAAVVAAVPAPNAPAMQAPVLDLVTEQDVNDAIRANRVELLCTAKAIITPAAVDRSAATGLTIRRV